jgi:primosomal protein N' (replication factor Y)
MSQSLFAADAADTPADTPEVARMALPLPVDGLFEYSVPPGLVAQAAPGCRALVRFGSRHLTGVIVERVREAEHQGELRPLVKLVDPEPVLSSALLDILREAAADVFCPLGMALATALPAGSTPRIVRGFALTPRGRAALASGVVEEETRPLVVALEERPQSIAALRARCGGAQADARLRALEDDGLVERREVEGRPTARVARQKVAALTPGVDLEEALRSLARAPRQAALLRCLAESGETRLDALPASFSGRLVRELSRRGLVAVHERPAPRDVLGVALEQDRSVTLSADQARALEPIEAAIAASRAETFLLHGVTGSGKTEIYLRGVGAALRAGRQALVLVPEISLTHQIVARLRGRFGDELAVLHSGLRPGERLEQWQCSRRWRSSESSSSTKSTTVPTRTTRASATTRATWHSGAPSGPAAPSCSDPPRRPWRCASPPTAASCAGWSCRTASGEGHCPPSRSWISPGRPSGSGADAGPS